jgi:hypothetical protein
LEGGSRPLIEAVLAPDKRSYVVSIDYKDYLNGYYRTGFDVNFKSYSEPFTVTSNTVIYAYGTYENIVSETSTAMLYEIFVPRPVISFKMTPDRTSAIVEIDFNNLPLMYCKTNEDPSWIPYTGPFSVDRNTVIYSKAGFNINTFSFVSMLPIEQIII